MPYLGYLLAQALKAGDTIAQAITSAANFVTKVGGSVVDLSPSVEALKSPSDGSAVFNGSSDYISTNNLPIQSSATWTISCWVYNDFTSGDADYIFDGREDTADGFSLYTTNGINFTYYDGNGGKTTSNFAASGNQWYHLTVVRDGTSSVKVYKNGSLTDTLSGAETSYSVTGNFIIGRRFVAMQYFEGNMSNFAIWSRALSASEIRSVMNKSYDDLNASETKGLVSWYALDDISGTTVPDSHGNYNGTAN